MEKEESLTEERVKELRQMVQQKRKELFPVKYKSQDAQIMDRARKSTGRRATKWYR